MGLLSSIGAFLGGNFGGILNFGSQMITNAQNERLMREGWGREDSAVQRRVADLRAAGLSPVLAAGQGASSGAPIRMEAPKLTSSGSALDVAAQLQQLKAGQAAIEKTKAETDLSRQQLLRSKAETAAQELANAFASSTNPMKVEREGLETALIRATQQSNIDMALRRANILGLEETNRRLDNVLKGMEIPKRVLDGVSQVMEQQLRDRQIKGMEAEIAVKVATVDMLIEREKAYTATAGRESALKNLIEKEAAALGPAASAGGGIGRALEWLFRERK